MADRPEDAYSPTDDELDELVAAAMSDDVDVAEDTAPEPVATDDHEIDAEADDRAEATGETAEGAPAGEGPEQEGSEPLEGQEPEAEVEQEPPVGGEPPKSKPFTFKGAGQEHTFPGATELADGSVRMSKEGAGQLRSALASALGIQSQWRTERRDLLRKLRTAESTKSDKDIEAENIVTLFKDVRAMTPEERWAWAQKFDEDAPKLEIAIEKAKLDRDRKALEAQRNGGDLLPEEQAETVQATLESELRTTFQRIMALPEAQHLTQEDKRALWDKWSKKKNRLVATADADMPEAGIRKGDLYFDDTDIVDDFNDRVRIRSQTKGTLSAAQRNQANNADRTRRNPVPPTVRSRTPQGNRSGDGKPKKRDARAYRRAFMKGDLDQKDE